MIRTILVVVLIVQLFLNVVCVSASSGPEAAVSDPYGTLYSIPFDKGSYELSGNVIRVIERNARALAAHPCAKVRLIGTAGSIEEPNQEKAMSLGKRRAEAVLKKHLSLNASASQIEAISQGSQTEFGIDEFDQSLQQRVVYEVSTWTDACPTGAMQENTDARFFKLAEDSGINLSNMKVTSNESIDKWSWNIRGKVYEPGYTNIKVPTLLGNMELNNAFGYSDDKYALEFYYPPNPKHKRCDLSDVIGISARVRLTEPTATREEAFLFVYLMMVKNGEYAEDRLKFTKPDEKTILGTISGDLPWVMIQIPAMGKPCPNTEIKNPPYYQTSKEKGVCRHAILFNRPHVINFELKCPE